MKTLMGKDWNFITGDLGNAVADIKDWMLPPYPDDMPDWQKQGRDNKGARR